MKLIAQATRGAIGIALASLLAGCATPPPKPLYAWENFPRLQYETLVPAETTPDEQINQLQLQAEHAAAAGEALPPGFRAHLGMLYLSAGNTAEAGNLWRAEKEAFPESGPYMDKLLNRLGAPNTKQADK